MPVRGLTVVVVTADAARFDAALTMVAAQAALGGRARLYLHDHAVTLLATTPLLDSAVELGATLIACQSAVDAHAVSVPEGVEGGGMVGLLATLDDDRLVFA